MISIDLYQPGRINCSIPFPSEWNELLPEELELNSRLSLSPQLAGAGDGLKALLLSGILSIRSKKTKQRLPKNFFDQLNAEDAVINGYPALDFLFTENLLTKQPYPTLRIPDSRLLTPNYKLKGPSDNFDDLTCGEFEDAEIFFNNFLVEPNETSLATLAAILYRPVSKSLLGRDLGRPSERLPYLRYDQHTGKYIRYDAEKMIPHFLKLPAEKLFTIFCWYVGCSNQIKKIFSNVFVSGASDDPPDPLAFTKCIHAGAGPKNGTRDNIRMMLLKEFLLDLDEESKTVKELKRKYERK